MHKFTANAAFGAALLLCASGALAQTGIDFPAMRQGCQWTIQFPDGRKWTDTYSGRTTFGYEIVTTVYGKPKQIVKATYFNAEGMMTRRRFPNGSWQAFTPYSCYDVGRTCQFTYTNAAGKTERTVAQTVKQGSDYTISYSTLGQVGVDPKRVETVRFGPYGIEVSANGYATHFQVSGFQNCGPVPKS